MVGFMLRHQGLCFDKVIFSDVTIVVPSDTVMLQY